MKCYQRLFVTAAVVAGALHGGMVGAEESNLKDGSIPLAAFFETDGGPSAVMGNPSNLLFPLDGTYTLVNFFGDGATGNRPATGADQHNDDDSATVALPFSFNLYGDSFTTAFVNNNGNISFGNPFSTFTASGFPSAQFKMIAGFWADVDTGSSSLHIGDVWQKLANNTLIVTWDNVGYFSAHSDKRNTFQIAISDGTNATMGIGNNVCFSYDQMEWTTGDASNGSGGFGGTAATVGANRGNGVDFFQIGRFGVSGSAYDGPVGATDGVDYLEGKTTCFSAATNTSNISPIATNFPAGNTVTVNPSLSQSLNLTVSFLSPEAGQTTSVSNQDPNGAVARGLVITNTPGNIATSQLAWSPTCGDEGSYAVPYTATDDFIPPGVTTVTLTIVVTCSSTGGPTLTPTPTPTETTPPTPTDTPVPPPALSSSNRGAAVLMWPKLLVDTAGTSGLPTDTVVTLSNLSTSALVQAHCFYVDATGRCRNDPGRRCLTDAGCVDASCDPGWSKIDFNVFLTRDQPLGWLVSDGLGRGDLPIEGPLGTCSHAPDDPSPLKSCISNAQCAPNGVCEIGPDGQNNIGTGVPTVSDPFLGSLTCIQYKGPRNAAVPDQTETTNSLIGEADIVIGPDPNTPIDGAKYNAIGFQATGTGNTDKVLRLGGPNADYGGCPQTLVFDHFFDGAIDPISVGPPPSSPRGRISTDLTLIPCGNDLRADQPGRVVAQFLVFNEFEQRFSTSRTVDCLLNTPLSNVDTPNSTRSIFSAGVAGTLVGQTRLQGVAIATTGRGLTGVLQMNTTRDSGAVTTSAYNMVQSGAATTADLITLP